ncbi:hypothetical protein [Soonwooa sp.]|uniref:hypothetical protein n=1 Tax=Soonwooa sp. TaxID=1938592 RepID=UPI0028A80EB1|nr:hypothetical protein [Soonwooa sp.]
MFRKNQQHKSIISSFIAGLYLLLLVFSPYLHQHHSEFQLNFSTSKDVKFEKNSLEKFTSANDCLACHFLTTNHSIEPLDFEFSSLKIFSEKQEFAVLQSSFFNYNITSLYLRGPPVFQL